MSEGGSFLWKRQEIDQHRGPAGSYKHLSKALPEPPENLVWIRNPDTKEWRLEERPETDFVATAEFIGESDLIVHDVRPEDTFEGICLRYKVNPTALRQANNGFQGSNLALAPNPLIIPTATDDNGNRRPSSQQQLVVDLDAAVDTHEQKIARLQKSCPHLSVSEAKVRTVFSIDKCSLDSKWIFILFVFVSIPKGLP